jgi:ribosome biogenesis GTPase A
MYSHAQRCSALLEVHDARVPVSGRNRQFEALGQVPRLILLNKVDLADPTLVQVG